MVSPWRISRSSTRTCRSLTSSNAVISISFFTDPHPEERAFARVSKDGAISDFQSHPSRCRCAAPQDEELRLADRAFEADRNQLLRFHRKLHRQLLQHVLDEAID